MPSLTQTGKGRVFPQAQEHAGDPYPPTPEIQKPRPGNSAGDASRPLDSHGPVLILHLSRTGSCPSPACTTEGEPPSVLPGLRARVLPGLRAHVPQPRARVLPGLRARVPQPRARVPQLRARVP